MRPSLPEGLAQQGKGPAVGAVGGGVAVVEAAFGTPGGGRVIDLHPANAVFPQLAPGLDEVLREFLVGVVVGHVRLMVRMLLALFRPGTHSGVVRSTSEPSLKSMYWGYFRHEVIRRHAELHVDVGDAVVGISCLGSTWRSIRTVRRGG